MRNGHDSRLYASSGFISRFIGLFFGAFAILLVLAGCGGSSSDRPDLPESPELHGTQNWAVITDPYARIHAGPDRGSAIVEVVRRGDLLVLAQRNAGDDADPDKRGLWYQVSEVRRNLIREDREVSLMDKSVLEAGAWVEGEVLELHAYELQALEQHRTLSAESSDARDKNN